MSELLQKFPTHNELLKKIRELQAREYESQIKIAILRNSTLEGIVPFLSYLLLVEGINPVFYFSDYNNYYQELLSAESNLIKFSPDIIFLSFDTRIELRKFIYEFTSLSNKDIFSLFDGTKENIKNILKNIKDKFKVPIILNGFEVPAYPSLSLFDSQNSNGQVNSIRKLNLDLVEISNNFNGVYFLDIDLVLARAGGINAFDYRFWYLQKNPYSRNALAEISKEYVAFILSMRGKPKKCLVVDLDDTLWGGIIGEDGFDGIKLGNSYPGSAFVDFQHSILNLYKRGIFICICSKNNEADVLDVIRNHPDMVLRESNFSIIKVNWISKSKNIKEIAKELNISLDSIVFIDDSPFEINLIQTELPEVTSILLDRNNPSEYPLFFESLGLFNAISFSEEDRARSKMYLQEVKRKSIQVEYENLDEYLKSLKMKVTFFENDHFTTSRIFQLSQRTNQFNVTTIRYSEEDIKEFINDSNIDVIAIKLEDKLGDLGVIGAVILKYSKKILFIDSLMISCRALGRNLENAIMKYIYDCARKRSIKFMAAELRFTNKNSQVHSFYESYGFQVIEINESIKKYKISIEDLKANKFLNYIDILKVE
jgi:FkbH-like protein